MANSVAVTIKVNTKPAVFAASVGSFLASLGLPAIVCFHAMRPLMWARFSHGRDRPWQGWHWLGRGMTFNNG